jgi:hypothetical protein
MYGHIDAIIIENIVEIVEGIVSFILLVHFTPSLSHFVYIFQSPLQQKSFIFGVA